MSNPVLIYDPNSPFKVWYITEIYRGPDIPSNGLFVPNVNDMIISWSTGVYRVLSVDTAGVGGEQPTYVPVLEPVDLSDLTKLMKGGYTTMSKYQPSVQERAFLNTLVIPYTINIDSRYRTYGLESVYMKVFQGVDISENGKVISQFFNGSGSLVSENVELVSINPVNPAEKRPPEFNTSSLLLDGEVITAVFYSLTGVQTGVQEFLVVNSNAVRGIGQNTKYITGINLVSNLLDRIELDLINVPANVPIVGADFRAELQYSDGSTELVAVGTPKCQLHGLDNFNTGVQGVISTVTLSYYLDSNEEAVNINSPVKNAISHNYGIRTVDNLNEYSFKVYPVPRFNPNTNTYSLDFYLTNVDYNILIKLDPTQYTLMNRNSNQIDYSAHPGAQTLTIVVDMNSVIPVGYSGFNFIQVFTLTLGPQGGIGWLIDFNNTSDKVYGSHALFEYSTRGQGAFSIRSGQVSREAWLAVLWEPIHAIYDEKLMLDAPTPTHFQLEYNGVLSPVMDVASYWNMILANTFNQTFITNTTMTVIWLHSVPGSSVYQTLGLSAVPLVNTLT